MKTSKVCIGRKLDKPFPSQRKFKKLQVCVKDKKGDIKNIHFGDKRYSDFTKHKDKERMKRFRLRHGCDPVKQLNKASAKYWACEELWK